MIDRLELTGLHTEITTNLQKYATKKIGKLDRYLSKHSRASAHAEVILSEAKAKDKKQKSCEVIMHLPKGTITVKESTINMFAAIDIVEEKLKNQLKKYKETHENPRMHQRLITKLRRADPAAGM
jgi:putative sigma-54 modulation protein